MLFEFILLDEFSVVCGWNKWYGWNIELVFFCSLEVEEEERDVVAVENDAGSVFKITVFFVPLIGVIKYFGVVSNFDWFLRKLANSAVKFSGMFAYTLLSPYKCFWWIMLENKNKKFNWKI